ncbi:MAG TPA: hypothetical protein VKB93_26910 [Thermoanaerobaculia bacterium]|nr:hypothetical protein [Thermoanaerobaculia bacterium]
MIRAPQAPPEVLAVLHKERGDGAREQALRVGAHQVFTATLTDVLERRVLAAAQATSWRDVAGTSAAEVAPREGEYVLTSINEGPFATATHDALDRARQLEGDYELRVLTIPSLYLFALWLHGENDVVIPMDPAPTGLNANEPYNEVRLTEALRPLAERRSTEPLV